MNLWRFDFWARHNWPSTLRRVMIVGGLIFALGQAPSPSRAEEPVQNPSLAPSPSSLVSLNLYTPFDEARFAPLLLAIKQSLNIEVNLVQIDKDSMAMRLQNSLLQPSPDLLLMADSGRLERLSRAGLIRSFTPIKKEDQFLSPEGNQALKEATKVIPPEWQLDKGQWLTVAKYARLLVIRNGFGRTRNISGFMDLTRPEYAQKICPNNQLASRSYLALIAQMLVRIDRPATVDWLSGVRRNFAPLTLGEQAPISAALPEEERILRQLSAQLCDIALVSSRSLAQLADKPSPQDQSYFKGLKIIWPQLPPMPSAENPTPAGVAMEAIGLALPTSSTHTKEAAEIAQFLLTEEGQKLLAEALLSYPIKIGVEIPPTVLRLGGFKADLTPLEILLPRFDEAAAIADSGGE